MPICVDAYDSLAALPPECEAAFQPVGGADFFATRTWYETVVAAALPAGARASFAVAADGRVVLPLLIHAATGSLQSLTTPYTCLFQPLVAPETRLEDIEAAGRGFGRHLRSCGTVRFDALPEHAPVVEALLHGARRAGLAIVRFRHFGNWHEPLAGRDWAAYLAGRTGALRETVRRKLRRAERDPTQHFEIIAAPADVARGAEAYERVYAVSWKEPEPFPAFNTALMHAASRHGVLRLGVLWAGEVPVAVQVWIVSGGTAAVLKLAHDEAYKALSPGTVLTALMLRHLLDVERVGALDFGRGDDPYKELWATQRRQRIGVVLANPLHTAGAAVLARHYAGRLLRRLRPMAR